MCEIVFAEIIDHGSRVKMIHHRPTVYTCRPVRLSSSKTHEYAIDCWATWLDSLPSLTQFLPRSGPRSMGKVAHWSPEDISWWMISREDEKNYLFHSSWPLRLNRTLFSMRKDFSYLCHVTVSFDKLSKMLIYTSCFLKLLQYYKG